MSGKPRVLYLDTETWSGVNLKTTGTHRYVDDPEASLLLVTWAWADGPVHCAAPEIEAECDSTVEDFRAAVAEADVLCAHGVQFDRVVLNGLCRFDALTEARWLCTQEHARIMGLPAALDALAEILLGDEKDGAGKRLIQLVSRTREHPDTWLDDTQRADLVRYAVQDTDLLRRIAATPWFSGRGYIGALDGKISDVAWRINSSGLRVDEDMARRIMHGLELYKPISNAEIRDATEGRVDSVTQTARLADCLHSLDPDIADTEKMTLQRLMHTHSDIRVRRIADLVLQQRASSVAKFKAMLDRSVDGVLRGELVPHGAHTGRWSSKGVQMQNLPKREVSAERVAPALALVREKGLQDAAHELKTTPVMVARDLIRTCIRPKRDVFVMADFKQIEARILHWYAKDQAALDIFADPTKDIYKTFGATLFRRPEAEIAGARRMLAKQAVLGMGYGMGAERFHDTCARGGLILDYKLLGLEPSGAPPAEERVFAAQYVVNTYRDANAKVPWLWRQLGWQIDSALHGADSDSIVPMRVMLSKDASRTAVWQLPSGNRRFFRQLRTRTAYRTIVNHKTGSLEMQEKTDLVYNSARGWRKLYGGKLAENLCQATAGDLLNHCLVQLYRDMDIVLTVHDEIVVDCKESEVDRVTRRLREVMTAPPAWAKGLPVDVEIETREFFS